MTRLGAALALCVGMLPSLTSAQVRMVEFDEVLQWITLRNFDAAQAIDISSWQLCRQPGTYQLMSNAPLISGDLALSPGEEVTVEYFAIVTGGTGIGIYANNFDFANPANMRDYIQYKGVAGFRDSVAVAAGLWTAGTFVWGDGPYVYLGNGSVNGAEVWANLLTLGQSDDFQEAAAGTRSWSIGDIGGGLGLPVRISTGGPDGPDDAYLQMVSSGTVLAGSRMVVLNDSQWSGNWIAAGIGAVGFDAINEGQTPMILRLALGCCGQVGPWLATTGSFSLPVASGWQAVELSVDPSDLQCVQGICAAPAVELTDIGELRILSAASPSHRGDVIAATLGLDNITALPEPALAWLEAGALLAVIALRRARRRA